MRGCGRARRLDSTRLGSAPPTPAPASRLSAALALPAKVHVCILCSVHCIRCISKSRRNKSQKYRSRGPREYGTRASPRDLATCASTDFRCRANAISIIERKRERERQPGEGARGERAEEKREREDRERERRKQRVEEEETRSRGDKDREIDDFSDALPRTKKSPLLSLGRVGKSATPENRFRGSRAGTSHRKTRPRSSARLDTLLRKPGSWLHGVCVRLRELSYHTGRCACTLGIRTYTHVRVIGIARTPGETLLSCRYWWGYDPRLVRKLNEIFWKNFRGDQRRRGNRFLSRKSVKFSRKVS